MQNGTRKGAGTETMPTLRASLGLEDIWQLHWAYGAGIEQNSAGVFIANVDDNATIAGILTAPPRGGGPGQGGAGRGAPGAGGPPAGGAPGAAPGAGASPAAAAAPGAPAGAPAAGGAPAGTPAAPQGGGRGAGGGGAAAHSPAYMIKI